MDESPSSVEARWEKATDRVHAFLRSSLNEDVSVGERIRSRDYFFIVCVIESKGTRDSTGGFLLTWAPFISPDIKAALNTEIEFDPGHPIRPIKHLPTIGTPEHSAGRCWALVEEHRVDGWYFPAEAMRHLRLAAEIQGAMKKAAPEPADEKIVAAGTGDHHPLTGDETAQTVNTLLKYDPPWAWKHIRTWLSDKGVVIYDRETWKATFEMEAPKGPGQPVFINEAELMKAIRDEQQVQQAAFDTMDTIPRP